MREGRSRASVRKSVPAENACGIISGVRIVHQGEIILFRHHGDVHIGRLKSADARKIKAATGRNRVVEIPAGRVLYATGVHADDGPSLDRFRQSVEEGAGTLDLREVWEVLKEEGDGYRFEEIAELHWGDEATTEQYGATLLCLTRGCPYFSEQETTFIPLPDERVEANLTRIARQRAVRLEHAAFIRWILSEETAVPAAFTNRQRHRLERIRQYAMLGDEYEQSAQAKELLREIREGDAGGDLRRYAFSLMVRKGIWDEDEHLDLIIHHVPIEFEDAAMAQAHALSLCEEDREDLTALSVFSIDDEATKDIDDAISLEDTEEGYRIGVHIADVSSVIPRSSPLDCAARERTTSLYFPDRHVPMLPPALSYARCSLLQDQRRPAVSYFYEVDRAFTLLRTRIVPSVIVNKAKLSYREVDRILEAMDHPLSEAIRVLNEAVDVFYAQRIEHGAIELERIELDIEVDADKRITVSTRTGQSRAEHIVSELMITTNAAAAQFFKEHDLPAIYRTQAEPGLKRVDDAPHEVVRRYMILRQLKPLALSLEPGPHAMLGVDAYCQTTSPIRRYIDLVLQRQLTSYLHGRPGYTREELQDEISHIEGSRELHRIGMRRRAYWLLKYLHSLDRQPLKAVVLEVREREVLVELSAYGTRASMRLTDRAAAGDEITVRVTQADPWSGVLRLVQIAEKQTASGGG